MFKYTYIHLPIYAKSEMNFRCIEAFYVRFSVLHLMGKVFKLNKKVIVKLWTQLLVHFLEFGP